ncbi:gametocyte-specific factor 1 isoform X2 [Betta splendens]|nr:gametocyte-specific factor 1 isoform X2 [Betta splendens]XP_029012793.1 gametocyte-specific factor 1 isoform X2 [Betta splendens]XP_029012796.1 gametocyte-specific factor 1 isoform X2 [Betta splendens]XP_055366498.1 gametocyte-specific factor 1 isoform X2 [Betta splendens]
MMATTIRFGSACGPCGTSTSERATVAEEHDKGNCDPEKLLQCPYDKNHQIRSCRFPYHIIKCRKNHPQLAKELKTCPFNARHLVHKHELARHIEACEDRISLDPQDDESSNRRSKWPVTCSTWVNPHTTENWDNEVDEYAAPFVWGTSTTLTQELDTRPVNDLGIRAPNTLPWCALDQNRN